MADGGRSGLKIPFWIRYSPPRTSPTARSGQGGDFHFCTDLGASFTHCESNQKRPLSCESIRWPGAIVAKLKVAESNSIPATGGPPPAAPTVPLVPMLDEGTAEEAIELSDGAPPRCVPTATVGSRGGGGSGDADEDDARGNDTDAFSGGGAFGDVAAAEEDNAVAEEAALGEATLDAANVACDASGVIGIWQGG